MAASLHVEGLSLDFPLYHGSARSLKRTVLAAAKGRMGEDHNKRVVVRALRDINFTLSPGDRLGLIGRNGAGKTSLLRCLAGIFEPQTGMVEIDGSLHALLDTGLGMNMELTGRENITLRGLNAGLSPAAIGKLAEDVEAFAELGDFIDLPVKFYSSGMVVRLGFGVATSTHAQILLMDEWFMAGDANFLAKARHRLQNLVEGAEILVLSSHNEAVLREWCTRLIWLDQGEIKLAGGVDEVFAAYNAA